MKRKCPICGVRFKPKHDKHIFCVRSCFRVDYNKRLREKSNTKPSFSCPKCGKLTKLNFDPRKNHVKWNNFVCPNCNYKNNSNY